MRALRHGEVDTAVVGAVDLCCEPVHTHAAATLGGDGHKAPGDAAVLLVLKRLEDAQRDADEIIAVVGDEDDARATPVGVPNASATRTRRQAFSRCPKRRWLSGGSRRRR